MNTKSANSNKLRTVKFGYLFSILLLFSASLTAQHTLTGTVLDKNSGEVLPAAHVKLSDLNQTTTTDEKGHFEFKKLKSGTYNLLVSYVGYKTENQSVDIQNDLNLSILLEVSPYMEEEVIISAVRATSGSPVSSQLIDKEKIAQQNQGKDLPYLLEHGISTVTTSDAGNGIGYTSMRIRGTDLTRINVTVNGIPLNDAESHNVFWVDLPDLASSTKDIQIQRGVGTSSNGVASFGASVNVLTENFGKDASAEFSTSYGSFNSRKNTLQLSTGLLNNHWSVNARMSRLHSDGFIDRAASDLTSFQFSGGYISKKDIIQFNVITGHERTYQAWDGIPKSTLDTNRTWNGLGAYYDNAGKLHFYPDQVDDYTQTHYHLNAAHKFTEKITASIGLHYTKGWGYYEQFKEDAELSDYGFSPAKLDQPFYNTHDDLIFVPDSTVTIADIVRRKNLNNDFYGVVWGLNYTNKKVEIEWGGGLNNYAGHHFGTLINNDYSPMVPNLYRWYESTGNKLDGNTFVKFNAKISDKINALIDLQLRHINYQISGIDDDGRNITQKHNFLFFNPKAGINYKIATNQKLYAFMGIARREPNRDNFVDANPALPAPKHESLYNGELGYEISGKIISAGANMYLMQYKDQLILTGAINDVGAPVMVNVPRSYRAGLEFMAHINLLPNLYVDLNTTLSRNKITSFTEYIDNWDDWSQMAVEHTNSTIAFSPSVIAGANCTWKPVKPLEISWMSKYVSKQYLDNTQSEERILHSYLDNKLIIGLNCSTKTLKNIQLTAQINNIFNAEYETNAWVYRYMYEGSYGTLDGYFPQAKRHFMLGLSVKI